MAINDLVTVKQFTMTICFATKKGRQMPTFSINGAVWSNQACPFNQNA
jgi:hypothetical protein